MPLIELPAPSGCRQLAPGVQLHHARALASVTACCGGENTSDAATKASFGGGGVPGAAWAIGLADTAAALLAGLVIFPIVFASGLDAAEGPGLIFVTLPVAFSHMPGAQLFGPLLFLLIFFAAFTSGLGMMEPFVSWAEERRGLNRRQAATLTGALVWTLGLAAVFSFNLWEEFTPLDFIPQLEGRTVFSLLDYVVSNFMLPLNAMLIALLAGWVINAQRMREDIGIKANGSWSIWQLSVRVLAPVGISGVFLVNLLS